MKTCIKAKLKKLDDIDKYRKAASITEYHNVLKFIFLRIVISKFMVIRQLFHVKNVKKQNV